MRKLQIRWLVSLLGMSLVGCGLSHAALPPIIDLYPTSFESAKVERLHEEIASLKKQLEKASIEIKEQALLIDRLHYGNKSYGKTFVSFFRNKTAPIISSKLNEAEKNLKEGVELLKTQQYEKATQIFQRVRMKCPEPMHQASSYYFLGKSSLLRGDPAESLYYFKVFIDRYADDARLPDAQLHMALAYYAQQNKAMAYKLLKQLEQNYPNHPVTKQARTHLKRLNLQNLD